MFSLKSHRLLRIVSASILLLLPLVSSPAQEDPDPNSPTPVLLTEAETTRALAAPAGKSRTRSLTRLASQAFSPDQKVELFVTNISLMDGEGANAFRMYMRDGKGRDYRVPVLEIRTIDSQPGVYSIVIRLTDEIRYWPAPTPDGDVLLRLTWRGLTSNTVLLGFGKIGGEIKDDSGSTPMP